MNTFANARRRACLFMLGSLGGAQALAVAPASQPASRPASRPADAWEHTHAAAYALISAGEHVDAPSAAALEKRVDANANDLYARQMLLGYYFEMTFGKDRPAPSPALVSRRQQNILWLIEHQPAEPALVSPVAILVRLDGDALTKGINLWRQQVEKHPDDVAILGNAAAFFVALHSPDAQLVLGHLIEIDTTNPKWFDDLSTIYRNAMRTAPRDRAKLIAERAMPVLTKWMELAKADTSRGTLRKQVAINRDLTHCSRLLDDGKTAAESCARLLKEAQAPGNAADRAYVTHHVHAALGLIALTQDKIADAKKSLVDSEVALDGGDAFAPDYALALALLQQGERAAVTEFLNATLKFCPASKPDVEKWIAEIEDHQTPIFEASVDPTPDAKSADAATKPAPKPVHP
jgi:hypothetical protein